MKNLAKAFIIVLLVFTGSLAILATRPQGLEALIIVLALALILVNFVLHLALAARGKLPAAALPAAWACCIAPLYIYSYHIENNPGYFGRTFLFLALGVLLLLPVFAVSLLTAVVSRRRKRAAEKRAEQEQVGTGQ